MAIDGLHYIPAFVHESQERELLAAIDAEPWLGGSSLRQGLSIGDAV